MANNYDTTTSFKVDISELKSAMQEAKRHISIANSEFKAVSSSMEDWTKSTDGLSAKLKQLDSNLNSQKTILSSLERQYELTVQEMGEGSAEADRLKIAINNQRAVVNNTEREIGRYETALENVANAESETGNETDDLTEDLDELTDGAKDASEGFTVFKGVLANLATQGINLLIDGVKSAGSALVGMVKESVSAYADYEQLVGGVETLFKDSSDTVLNYANNAYKTAGLSANEYMETVTSFSASLLSALEGDTAESAKIADMAITDMADNANKMGTDISSIQNAYNGFAKQNYTMLDNLKLGYGGTKAEMERLLADASALSGQEYDISNLNDVFNAIHVIQTELGITGTTAKEASTTISGSIASMKSSWQNLLAGMADENADFGLLVNNLVESVTTMLGNVMPRVIQAISGVSQLISGLAPVLAEQVPILIDQVLPTLLASLTTLLHSVLNAILGALPSLTQTLLSVLMSITSTLLGMLPELTDTVVQMISILLTALSTALPDVVMAIIEIVPQIIEALLAQLPTFIETCVTFLMAIVEAIPTVIQALVEALPTLITTIIDGLVDGIDALIQGAITLLMAIVDAIPIIIPILIEALPQIINTVVNGLITALPQILQGAITLFMAIIQAIPTIVIALAEALPQIIVTIITALVENIPLLFKTAYEMFMMIVKAIPDMIKELKKALPNVIKAVTDGLKSLPDKLKTIGSDMIKGLWNGINDMTGWIKDKIKGFGDSVVSGLKDFFGIHSPSKLLADEVGKYLPEGIAVGIDKNAKSVMDAMRDLTANTLNATMEGLDTAGLNAGISGGVVNNFYQTNNSPKALSRLDIYRQSKNLLAYAGGGY